MPDDPIILYIIFPSDIAKRLTPGQIAAQAAHAATAHASACVSSGDEWTEEYEEWGGNQYQHEDPEDGGFGITLVGVVDPAEFALETGLYFVTDPYVHFRYPKEETAYDVETCGWMMCRKSEFPKELSSFKLLTDEYLLQLTIPSLV